jgi:hypothetical protein
MLDLVHPLPLIKILFPFSKRVTRGKKGTAKLSTINPFQNGREQGYTNLWLLSFVRCRLLFVNTQDGTRFMSPFWHLEIKDIPYGFAKFVHPRRNNIPDLLEEPLATWSSNQQHINTPKFGAPSTSHFTSAIRTIQLPH